MYVFIYFSLYIEITLYSSQTCAYQMDNSLFKYSSDLYETTIYFSFKFVPSLTDKTVTVEFRENANEIPKSFV